MAELPDSVRAMLDHPQAPTAPLDDFLPAYTEDDNLWWRIGSGHHQNLFEEAIERMWDAERELERMRRGIDYGPQFDEAEKQASEYDDYINRDEA